MCLTTVAVPHPSMPEGNPERQQSVKMVEKLQGFPNHAMYSREGKTWAIWKRGQPALRCQRAPTLGPAVMVASNPKRLKPISPRSPGPHAPYHNQQTQQTDALRMLQRNQALQQARRTFCRTSRLHANNGQCEHRRDPKVLSCEPSICQQPTKWR